MSIGSRGTDDSAAMDSGGGDGVVRSIKVLCPDGEGRGVLILSSSGSGISNNPEYTWLGEAMDTSDALNDKLASKETDRSNTLDEPIESRVNLLAFGVHCRGEPINAPMMGDGAEKSSID
jgi:hypothetical protein